MADTKIKLFISKHQGIQFQKLRLDLFQLSEVESLILRFRMREIFHKLFGIDQVLLIYYLYDDKTTP